MFIIDFLSTIIFFSMIAKTRVKSQNNRYRSAKLKKMFYVYEFSPACIYVYIVFRAIGGWETWVTEFRSSAKAVSALYHRAVSSASSSSVQILSE